MSSKNKHDFNGFFKYKERLINKSDYKFDLYSFIFNSNNKELNKNNKSVIFINKEYQFKINFFNYMKILIAKFYTNLNVPLNTNYKLKV